MVQELVRYIGPAVSIQYEGGVYRLLLFDDGFLFLQSRIKLSPEKGISYNWSDDLERVFQMDYQDIQNNKFGWTNVSKFVKYNKISEIRLSREKAFGILGPKKLKMKLKPMSQLDPSITVLFRDETSREDVEKLVAQLKELPPKFVDER